MRSFDIVTPKHYTSNGQQRRVWLTVGALRITDGGQQFIEWHMMPDITYMIVESNSETKGRKFNSWGKSENTAEQLHKHFEKVDVPQENF